MESNSNASPEHFERVKRAMTAGVGEEIIYAQELVAEAEEYYAEELEKLADGSNPAITDHTRYGK